MGLWAQAQAVQFEALAIEVPGARGEQLPHDLQCFVETIARLVLIDAEPSVLRPAEAAAHAEDDLAARPQKGVEHVHVIRNAHSCARAAP